MQMKIAQIAATFPPYFAGTSKVCYYNSLVLARLGHEVTVFTSRYPDVDYEYPDPIKVVRWKPLFRVGNAPVIPRLMTLEGFDIIHLHFPFIFGAELVALNATLRKNYLVVTCHQDLFFSGFLGCLAGWYSHLVGNWVLWKADKILTPSLDHLVNSRAKYVIEKRKADVLELPNGVDTQTFNPNIIGDDIKNRHNIGDRKVILFVGALDKAHWFKRVDVLIMAFSRMRYENAVLVIVGEGELKRNYQNLAGKLGIADKVIFAGSVCDGDLPKYYSISDLFVLPSTSSGEIFGLVLVEAMACGKPVIATDLPGVRTVVDPGENGFLVKPGDVDDLAFRMRYLLDNEHMREEFGRRGRKKVEDQYSWDKIGKKLEGIYREVLESAHLGHCSTQKIVEDYEKLYCCGELE